MALDAILAHKRDELARRKATVSLESHLAACSPSDRDFAAALRAGRPGFVLEVKFASPSRGTIRRDTGLAPVLAAYRHADAISVLTDELFFGGSLERLAEVRRTVPQPVLCKDFILEPYQVAEARRHGADAILLILAAVDDDTWRACSGLAERLRMAVITEAHSADELDRAVALGAAIVGINNRDLHTLAIDPATTSRLAPRVPADRLVVAESGISSREDVEALRPFADAVLVGSSLMMEPDIDLAVRRLVYGRTKICGLTSREDAALAHETGATHGGLVFVDGSPRKLTMDQARRVRSDIALEWVGLFLGRSPAEIATTAAELDLAAVQLYGYDRGGVSEVRARLPARCETWAAARVTDTIPRRADSGADRLLLDAAADGGGALGGSGRRFDWGLLRSHEERREVVLAGGIHAGNVAEAASVGTWALDLSSGVESAPGRKDGGRLRAFFDARRQLPGRGDGSR